MQKFQATAKNKDGYTFRVTFFSAWGEGIQADAQKAVDAAVAQDTLHQKFGPWNATNIDVTA